MSDTNDDGAGKSKRKRAKKPQRPFPAASFEDALEFAKQIFEFGSGQPVRKLTLFDELGRAPDSGASRMLITNANRYGLIAGNYNSDQLELTSEGLKAAGDGVSGRERARTLVELAIDRVEPFSKLYDAYQNNRLPAQAVIADKLRELGVPEDFIDEGVETFIVNVRFVGLLQTLSGADRIVTLDHMLDGLPASPAGETPVQQTLGLTTPSPRSTDKSRPPAEGAVHADFKNTCFYVTPIGEEDSEVRKHSDLFLGSIVEPAVASFGLNVLRADAIDKPGMITRQVMEYIFRSRLVIADLSFHNPNVFYELALRHSTRLPIVQIVRSRDPIPFDIQQVRTVVIDDTDIYAFVPKIEAYRADVSSQVRRALEETSNSDNPLSTYFPDFTVASL